MYSFENWEYSRTSPSFSWGIFGLVMHLDQSHVNENIWWITIMAHIPSWLAKPMNYITLSDDPGFNKWIKHQTSEQVDRATLPATDECHPT